MMNPAAKRRMGRFLAATLVAVVPVAALTTVGSARAEDFRVENRVFLGADKQPVTRTTTLFYQGVVYDYLEDPAEITIFDAARDRFVLLNPPRRIKTELSVTRVKAFVDELQRWALLEQPHEFFRFLAAPELEETVDDQTGRMSFASPWITYELTTTPLDNPDLLHRYREFCDAQCLLNTRIDPGSRPPQARLIVNAALAEQAWFPVEVRLTLRPRGAGPLGKKITARSEHKLVRWLPESDRKRIARTDRLLATFRELSFADYQAATRAP